jgi:hypothetical protein
MPTSDELRPDFERLDGIPEHLRTQSPNDRGFNWYPPLPGDYGGDVRVSESSAAEGPHLWLTVRERINPNDPASELKDAGVHLTAEDAWRLHEQLERAVRTHYHGDATPEWARTPGVAVTLNDATPVMVRPEELLVLTVPATADRETCAAVLNVLQEHGVTGIVVLDAHAGVEYPPTLHELLEAAAHDEPGAPPLLELEDAERVAREHTARSVARLRERAEADAADLRRCRAELTATARRLETIRAEARRLARLLDGMVAS